MCPPAGTGKNSVSSTTRLVSTAVSDSTSSTSRSRSKSGPRDGSSRSPSFRRNLVLAPTRPLRSRTCNLRAQTPPWSTSYRDWISRTLTPRSSRSQSGTPSKPPSIRPMSGTGESQTSSTDWSTDRAPSPGHHGTPQLPVGEPDPRTTPNTLLRPVRRPSEGLPGPSPPGSRRWSSAGLRCSRIRRL